MNPLTAPESPHVIVRRAAMNLLARREHSFHELLQKLVEKFPDLAVADLIVPVLHGLQDENLQSDQRFAQSYVRYRSSRGFGPLKIAAELYSRKLTKELLKSALYETGPDWELLCTEALQRKFKIITKPTADERLRWQRFLLQRGFDLEQIGSTIKMLLASIINE